MGLQGKKETLKRGLLERMETLKRVIDKEETLKRGLRGRKETLERGLQERKDPWKNPACRNQTSPPLQTTQTRKQKHRQLHNNNNNNNNTMWALAWPAARPTAPRTSQTTSCPEGTRTTGTTRPTRYAIRKEIQCSRDSEILHEIVRDTMRISSCFSDFCGLSRTISCSISKFYHTLFPFCTTRAIRHSNVRELEALKQANLYFFGLRAKISLPENVTSAESHAVAELWWSPSNKKKWWKNPAKQSLLYPLNWL